MVFQKRDLPLKSESLSKWYNKVVFLSNLVDQSPAKGMMIYLPYAYEIWENIQQSINASLKTQSIRNCYFPSLIPESLLKKETTHLEGFSPELAVVTIAGGDTLTEPLVVRPTSETIMYDAYARWIHSWRDLPLKLNQWNSVVRWEKRTYAFLRSTEFLWHEAHTAHATHEESLEMVMWAIEMYRSTYEQRLAIPGYMGQKPPHERFAGADDTWTYETLMPEGKVLQSCTAHDLGQNFSKQFDIKFQDAKGQWAYPWQTSFGLSMRAIGACVMVHGDDAGLCMPPAVAPIQIVIVIIHADESIMTQAHLIYQQLSQEGLRCQIDDRMHESIGSRIAHWELKGVPIRLEMGRKDIALQQVSYARRDTLSRQSLPIEGLPKRLVDECGLIQQAMYQKAKQYLEDHTFIMEDEDVITFQAHVQQGFVSCFWCQSPACAEGIQKTTQSTVRCRHHDRTDTGPCVGCQAPHSNAWFLAKSY